jgi:hypothetical protein
LRHGWGASYVIAVSLRKSVKVGMASVPSHFKHYSGNILRPVLLLALKCFYSTHCTSGTVNLAVSASFSVIN